MGILCKERHVDMWWLYPNRSNSELEWEHFSKTQKYWIAHNFFNSDHNMGILDLISIVLMSRSPTGEEFFSNLSYPILTTVQNDEKLHIFWFHFFSHPFYMGIICKERYIQMRLMYLNRSNRKLEWEHFSKTQRYCIANNFFIYGS